MIALGFGIMWLGYNQTIFGWTLLKGWNIRWRDLANPIHPYQWPPLGSKMPMVPAGQVLPTGGASTTAAKGSTARPPLD